MKRMFHKNNKSIPQRNERNVFDFGYKKNIHSLPQWYALIVLIVILTIGVATNYLLFQLPDALTVEDPKTNPPSFISQRAWQDLKILNNFGPRVVGTYANEVLAVDFFKREINFIQQMANPNQRIYADVQKVSGGFWADFKPQGMTSVYRNIQNIIVKVSGESEGKGNHSILLNCHFDSVPGSPGASDDGGSCTVMLEILRIVSTANIVNKHSIIFLFNGAEETMLQASHGFITKHPWASDVRAFINIESAGSNGKEILFQTGPNHSWLVDMYSKSAPHPFGNTVGEEVFQSGFIPSDTDFRIFRDFGNIPGLDLAHPMNGYRYHTKYDHIKYIPMSCLQRTGDNVLALVRNIANSDELADPKAYDEGKKIYFDLVGLYFVSYSENAGTVANVIVAVLAVLIPFVSLSCTTKGTHTKHIRREMFIGFFNNILAVALSAGVCFGIATELDKSDSTMSWYTHTIVALLLYSSTVVLVCCAVHRFVLKSTNPPFSLGLQTQARLNGTNIMWSILLLTTTSLQIRSAYLFFVPLLINLISSLVISFTGIQNSVRNWLYVHVFYQVFLLYWATNTYNLLIGIFIPMIGRSGGMLNPEITVAAICLAVTLYSISFITPLIALLSRTKWIFISLLTVIIVTRYGIISSSSIGFPYRDDSGDYPTPQRHFISHTQRTIYDINGRETYSDSGFWVRQLDRNTKKTIESLFAPEIPVPQEENIACSKAMFCGLPFHSCRHIFSTGFWLPGPPPLIREEGRLKLTSNKVVNSNEKELKFELTGNLQMSIGIQPKDGVELIGWDLTDTLSPPNEYLGKKVYLVAITNGLNVVPLDFALRFKVDGSIAAGQPIADIMLVSYHWEYHKEHTPYFTSLLNKLPSWAYAVPSVSSYKSWTF